ncbi:hypothetical protein QF001_003778 [Paraburkholderia youngii]|uniref:XkdW family protein n=1 Tax=Paraburkholderia youngii TaxID=2782701 RepID=UPI003D20B316
MDTGIDFKSYTHDLAVLAMKDHYPALKHGVDYLIGHPLDPATGVQNGDPKIYEWRSKDVKQPTDAELTAMFRAKESEYRAAFIRGVRNEALANTDGKATAPDDAPANVRTNADAWKTYRQALRDIPQQAGFPFSVEWPARPV